MKIAAIFVLGAMTLTSCGSDVEETSTQYTCPMTECEDGKAYAEKGTCPVCEMDLIEKE